MALMRACNRQGCQHRGGFRTGLKVSGSVENGGLVDYFFGEDGNARLQLDKFVKFLRELHDEVSSLVIILFPGLFAFWTFPIQCSSFQFF